jgi:hypothetical protein
MNRRSKRFGLAGLVLIAACAAVARRPLDPLVALGLSTRAPSEELAERLDLPLAVRRQGQEVVAVEPGGLAQRIGLSPGDVLMRLDANELYSRDDLADFLRTRRSSEPVEILVRRGDSGADETLRAVLPAPDAASEGIAWRFAGLAQLDEALAVARAEGRGVLVGLSGAET